jgi:predicted Zn-dependent protease
MGLTARTCRFVTAGLLAVLLGAAAGCGIQLPGSSGGGEGPGHRQQRLALSPEEEIDLGREAYRKVLQKMRDRILPSDSPEVVRARRVCARIIQAVGIRPLQKEINLRVQGYRFEWEVNVVRDEQVNAFCLPAGKIIVFTGILPVAENDDQLAAVLAHEIAHALAHHGSERVAREQAGGGNPLSGLKFDRFQESEADHIGLFLMTFAGYDPDQAVHFWERMQRSNRGSSRPEILSDHPSDEHRVRALREWVPKARAAKRALDEGRVVRD